MKQNLEEIQKYKKASKNERLDEEESIAEESLDDFDDYNEEEKKEKKRITTFIEKKRERMKEMAKIE